MVLGNSGFGNVDGVAAHTVQAGEHLAEHDTSLGGAFPGPEAIHVVLLCLLGFFSVLPLQPRQMLQGVNAQILGMEPGNGSAVELLDIVVQLGYFLPGGVGIGQALFGAALADVEQVLGVVTDSLQIAECLEHPADIVCVRGGQLLYVE